MSKYLVVVDQSYYPEVTSFGDIVAAEKFYLEQVEEYAKYDEEDITVYIVKVISKVHFDEKGDMT